MSDKDIGANPGTDAPGRDSKPVDTAETGAAAKAVDTAKANGTAKAVGAAKAVDTAKAADPAEADDPAETADPVRTEADSTSGAATAVGDSKTDTDEVTAAPKAAEPARADTDSTTDTALTSGTSKIAVLRERLRPGPKGAVAVRTAIALLLGASLAASVYYFFQDRSSEAQLAAHEEARAAACAYAPILSEYDAKNLDAYFAAVLAGATGDWKKQFDDTSKELREVLTQGQVVSKANDVQCAIKSGDETSAEAIVVIGQTITSVGTQGKPAPGQLSMVMRMEKVDGKWLVNKVNSPLATPAQ